MRVSSLRLNHTRPPRSAWRFCSATRTASSGCEKHKSNLEPRQPCWLATCLDVTGGSRSFGRLGELRVDRRFTHSVLQPLHRQSPARGCDDEFHAPARLPASDERSARQRRPASSRRWTSGFTLCPRATTTEWEYRDLPANLNFPNRRMRTRTSGGVGGDQRTIR